MRMDLTRKMVVFGAVQLLLVCWALFVFYYFQQRAAVREQYVEKARSVVLTVEAYREEMGRKWDQKVHTVEQMREWGKTGDVDKMLAAVPVVTAYRSAMAKADAGGYKFRVPTLRPRNPRNTPDEAEARVLARLSRENLAECVEIDEGARSIRYFRPIRLTSECLLCHGDPATAKALWGNDQGLDPTGAKMEGWKVGDVHGAFEVIQSLDAADAQIAAALWRGAGLVGILALIGAAMFAFVVSRTVVRPIVRIVSGLTDGANQVNDAAEQVAGSSQHLAEAASEQASSLEETSSALEQVSAMTRASATNASEANDLSQRAREAAIGSDRTIQRLNAAMIAINESSAKISRIIKVIEEIAFQTNLLALNAAVEAARAGESGRGFAVVADEVRNLAQRAAQAARETTVLIEDSASRAKEGTEVAGAVGATLGGIATQVTTVSDLVGQITRAANEQAQGVEQVNAAVSQMDKITQQNAAGAEQSAAAAEELSAQASTVKGMVNELLSLVTAAESAESGASHAAARHAQKHSWPEAGHSWSEAGHSWKSATKPRNAAPPGGISGAPHSPASPAPAGGYRTLASADLTDDFGGDTTL